MTAASKREEGNELFRAGNHAAAAQAYGEAIGLVATEVGALAMDAVDLDADPDDQTAPDIGMVPSKLKEICVACHANRAACYLALAEEGDGSTETAQLSVKLAGEEVELSFVVPEFGAQTAALVDIKAVPLPMVGTVAKGAERFAVVLDGATLPIAGWGKRARDVAKAFPAVAAILIVNKDDVLHFPTEGAASDSAGMAAPGPEVPVACLRRDEGAALLSGAFDALTLRYVEPAAFYRRVVDDCTAARNLAGGTHAKAQLRLAQALEALGRLEAANAEYAAAAKEEDAGVRKKARSGVKRTRGCIKAAKEGAALMLDQTVWAVSSAPLQLKAPAEGTAVDGDAVAVGGVARFVAVVGLDSKGLRQIAGQVVNEGGAKALSLAARDVLATAASTEMVAADGAGRRPRMVIADASQLGHCAIGLLRGCASGLGLPLLVDDEACVDLRPLAASV